MCGWGTVLGVSKSRLLQDLNSDQEPLGNAASSSNSAAHGHSLHLDSGTGRFFCHKQRIYFLSNFLDSLINSPG